MFFYFLKIWSLSGILFLAFWLLFIQLYQFTVYAVQLQIEDKQKDQLTVRLGYYLLKIILGQNFFLKWRLNKIHRRMGTNHYPKAIDNIEWPDFWSYWSPLFFASLWPEQAALRRKMLSSGRFFSRAILDHFLTELSSLLLRVRVRLRSQWGPKIVRIKWWKLGRPSPYLAECLTLPSAGKLFQPAINEAIIGLKCICSTQCVKLKACTT